ncbi:MAG: Uncharacterised protein [Pseudidiomarina mangrovi]|nr:MAG: Uncharacterised protein [Pseudidiomarina mangrovi]
MRRLTVILLSLLVIVGCSNRFGYRFADTLVEWRLADYVALSGQLEDDVSASIDALHLWHAQTQLPLYRQHLTELRNLISNDELTEADVLRYSDIMYSWWGNVRVALEPYALRYMPQLSVAQRQQIIETIQADIDERREEIAETEFAELLKRSQKRMENNISDWIGRLESGQMRYLRRWLDQREDVRLLWLDYQQLWLDEFSLVLNQSDQQQFEQRMRELILTPEQMRPEALQQSLETSREATLTMIYSLYQSLTPKQKHRLVSTINGYLDDLDSLIADYAN